MNSSSKGGETKASLQFPTQTHFTLRLPFDHFLRASWVYILTASLVIVTLASGAIFVLPSLLPKPDPFPPLCSGHFQSANTSVIPAPETNTSSDGIRIGLSEGATIFDLQRPDQQEAQDKLQAAQDWANNSQNVLPSLTKAISSDQTDAEAQIYLENWQVFVSKRPHITLVVGTNFASPSVGGSRSTLQGAFTAQKECNDQSRQNGSKTQVVLMIANIGGDDSSNRASSAQFVANQIVNQADKDTTIVGIMGWPSSTDSINVNHQLKIKASHLPIVSPSSSGDELETMANFFRVCPTNSDQAQIAANFMLNVQHKKRIAIVYDQTIAYSNNLKDDFAKDIPSNMPRLTVPFTGGDFRTSQDNLNNVLAQHPDALFFAGYTKDLVELLNTISSTPSANLLIVGGDALAVTNSYKQSLPNHSNVYFTSFASPHEWDKTNLQPPFFQAYKTNFGTLTASTGFPSIDADVMLSYDAMLTLLYGTQQVHSKPDAITLTQALKQIAGTKAIQGITGRIAFDSNGNQDQNKPIFVEHIDRTKLVIDESHGCLLKDNCSS